MEQSILEKSVRSLVKRQALKIIYYDLKKFNHYAVHYTSRKIFLRGDFSEKVFYIVVARFYKKEKERLQKKYSRIKSNQTILAIKNRYPLIDVELLAYYLNIIEVLNFKTPKHYESLEQIIRITLLLEDKNTTCNKYKNYKYIKKIQDEIKIVDVNYLACFINSIKGFNFKSKQENEILENIIKIVLSIPISIVNKTKLKSWQVDIKFNMQIKEEQIREIIKNNLTKNIL